MNLLHEYTADEFYLLKKYTTEIDTLSYFYKPSFVHLWKLHDDIHIFEGKYGLYIYMKASNAFLMPWARDMHNALEELMDIAKEENTSLLIKSIPDEYIHYFDDTIFELNRDRNLDEYIYLQEKLIGLSGKHLQSKRNHISQFLKAYPDYSLQPLSKDDEAKILEMTRLWLLSMPDEFQKDLQDEYKTIERAFASWDLFDFSGAILKIDGNIVAYTLGEKQGDEVIVHYEKANTDYHGTYTMINREYQLNYAPKSMYVNRMEDAGVEGLRRAKESYKPYQMVKKWKALLK